mgnify:CR=1 FL=1
MMLKNSEILLTEPRGFCAGVDRAIEIVNRAVEIFDETIFVKHEVVHNKHVIEQLVKKGVVFVESLETVPDQSILIYSAHGVSKEISELATKKRLKVFNATCPLVTKVHFEIHKFASQNIDVVLVGHSGHPEVEGTMGQYISEKGKIHLVETNDDIDKFNTAMEEQGMNPLQKYIPLDVDKKTFDGVCQSEWFMPEKYKKINLYEYVLGRLSTPAEDSTMKRVWEELDAFKERGLHDLLRYMIYLVDFMRENNIVWGVGRGSSVASYVLYIIGVHRVNSIQFDLDWREFLR